MTKPKTLKEWERVCNNLNKALQSTIEDVLIRDTKIDNLEEQIGKLEEQITMSVGVIKYLELQLEKKSGR
jgi:uncharacterized protein (DUF3084 family)